MFSIANSSSINSQSLQQRASSLFQALGQTLTATSTSTSSPHDDDKLSEMEKGLWVPDTIRNIEPATYVPQSHTSRTSSHGRTTQNHLVIDDAPERPQVSAPAVFGDDSV